MIVDSQTYCVLEYLPEFQCMLQTWKGFAGSEKFRQSVQKTIDFFQTHQDVRYIISNTLEQGPVSPKDAEWVATVANPILEKHGLRKMAFIVPQNVITKMAEELFARQLQGKVEIRWFADLASAKAWIQQP
jgi:hypothetical protein